MICPRCLSDRAVQVASAPDGSGAWEFFHCEACHFGWRSTEPPQVIDAQKRDPWFQLDASTLDQLPVVIELQNH